MYLDFKSVQQLSTLLCPSLQSPNDKTLVATSQASPGGPKALKALGEPLPLSLSRDDMSDYCADCTGQCMGRCETF